MICYTTGPFRDGRGGEWRHQNYSTDLHQTRLKNQVSSEDVPYSSAGGSEEPKSVQGRGVTGQW